MPIHFAPFDIIVVNQVSLCGQALGAAFKRMSSVIDVQLQCHLCMTTVSLMYNTPGGSRPGCSADGSGRNSSCKACGAARSLLLRILGGGVCQRLQQRKQQQRGRAGGQAATTGRRFNISAEAFSPGRHAARFLH